MGEFGGMFYGEDYLLVLNSIKKCVKKYGFELELSKDLLCKIFGLLIIDVVFVIGVIIGVGYVIYRVI